MSIIDIAYALTAPVEAVMVFLLCDAFFTRRKAFPAWQYAIGILVLTLLIRIINTLMLFQIENAFAMIAAAILVSFYFYQTSLAKRIAVNLFSWALFIGAFEVLTMNLICLVFHITANEVVNIPEYVILGIIVSKSLGLAGCYGIHVKNKHDLFELKGMYWLLFVALFAASVVVAFLIMGMLTSLDSAEYNVMATICSIGLFGATFLALYLYERSLRQNRLLRIREKAEIQFKSQIKHMDEIILKQNEIRRMRHDMNNQLVALKGYIDAGDFAGSARYLASLSDQLAQTSPAINTGNNALDAVLGAKQAVAEDHGIHFTSTLRIQENLPIAPEDLCVIFGNALDNAIEACDRLPEECEKRISLTFLQNAHSLSCKIENTAAPGRPRTLATSKADKENHGFGLQNITETLAKYDSTPIITQSDNSFSLGFVIFLPRK